MHKNATKCNETLSKWCKNKHGALKIIDMFETYQRHQVYVVITQESLEDLDSTGNPLVKLEDLTKDAMYVAPRTKETSVASREMVWLKDICPREK
jgi:hypothetical protein